MKIHTDKRKIIISAAILVVLLLLILRNYKVFLLEDKFITIAFVLSILSSIISCAIFAIKIECSPKTSNYITIFSFVLSIVFSYIIIELLNQATPFSLYLKRLIFNFIVIIFLHLLIYAIFNRFSTSILISNFIIFMLGAINYVVVCFRGTPFVPWDILSIKTAAHVAGTYSFSFNYYFLLATTLLLLILSIGLKANYKFKNTKSNVILRVVILLTIISSILIFYNTDVINYFDFENNFWKPIDEYTNNGFLASFIKQSKNLFNSEPENYSIQHIENILSKLEYKRNETTSPEEYPNIIVIMNESYCDLSVNR